VNRHALLLLLVVLYTAGFRLLVLNRPFHYDPEGGGCFNGVLARTYLRFGWRQTHGLPVLTVGQNPTAPIVFYPDHPPLVPLLIVPFYAGFGVGEWQTRFPLALVTIGAVCALYALVCRHATPRVAVMAAALFAATPMTLYFGGFPDVIGMPLVLLVLVCLGAYLRFHREPRAGTFAAFVGTFVLAGVCDWPAYLVVPILAAHFVVTRPFREWPWIVAFGTVACALFAAMYAYIAIAADLPWNWMVSVFSKRSGVVGASQFTLWQWLGAAAGFNRTYHTIPLLVASAAWVLLFAFRRRTAQSGATTARLLLAWGALYVAVGSKAVYDHEWPWMLLTPGIAVATALLIEWTIHASAVRRLNAVPVAAGLIVVFASWSAYTTFTRLSTRDAGRPSDPRTVGAAIRAAAPDPNDVALLIGGEELEPQLWFYGDRPLRTRVWTIAEFERRRRDSYVDLVYDFKVQPWNGAATGFVFPKRYRADFGRLHAFLAARYPSRPLPAPLSDTFEVFDLR
jgi:Dolichyl-phosphate-mannose-protein mannosyltransferase